MDIWNLIYERKSFFIDLCLEHLMISAVAIIIAIAAGGVIGILLSEYPRFSKPVIGVVNFLYTIPSISMLGFLIPLSGIGNVTAVLALTIYDLLPMVRNTYTGITNVDPAMTEAAEGMGSTVKRFSSEQPRSAQNIEKMYVSGVFGGLPNYTEETDEN